MRDHIISYLRCYVCDVEAEYPETRVQLRHRAVGRDGLQNSGYDTTLKLVQVRLKEVKKVKAMRGEIYP